MAQQTFIEVPERDEVAEVAPRAPRQTSKAIGPGDIVEVDKRGRRFHALVVSLEQGSTGRFELEVRPLDGRTTYRQATVREVVTVWRKAR
jgi:hypothetical protein